MQISKSQSCTHKDSMTVISARMGHKVTFSVQLWLSIGPNVWEHCASGVRLRNFKRKNECWIPEFFPNGPWAFPFSSLLVQYVVQHLGNEQCKIWDGFSTDWSYVSHSRSLQHIFVITKNNNVVLVVLYCSESWKDQ